LISNETTIDLLRAYLHFASEYFGRKNILEAIKRWRKEKPRRNLKDIFPTIPLGLHNQERREK
jgi:hypothetical protein